MKDARPSQFNALMRQGGGGGVMGKTKNGTGVERSVGGVVVHGRC